MVFLCVLTSSARSPWSANLWAENATHLNNDSTEKYAQKVKDAMVFPFNTIAYLEIIWGDSPKYQAKVRCTGFFLLPEKPMLVVTAGHCLRNANGRLANLVTIKRAYNEWSENPVPYGEAWAIQANIYVSDQADWGFVVLDDFDPDFIPPQQMMGYLTHEHLLRIGEDPILWFYGKLFDTAGYPALNPEVYDDRAMYHDRAHCTSASDYSLQFAFDFSFPSEKGYCKKRQSGSPVWSEHDGYYKVVGILVQSDCSATKLRDYMIDIMQSFKKEEGTEYE